MFSNRSFGADESDKADIAEPADVFLFRVEIVCDFVPGRGSLDTAVLVWLLLEAA